MIWSLVVFFAVFSVCYYKNHEILDFVNRPLEKSQHGNGKDALEQSARYAQVSAAAQKLNARALRGQRDLNDLLARDAGTLSTAQRSALARQSRLLESAAKAQVAAAAATPKATGRQPITLGVTEPFVTTFTVAGYAALLVSLPFLLFQAYAFVLPAFSPAEKRVALPVMLMVPLLFISGAAFGYYVALPRAIDFLQNFNDDQFDILIRASDYYRFSVILIAVIGLLFQIPVGVLAVTRLGIISARQLSANRGYVILGLSIVAAIATPTPDPVTMLIAMAPLIVLFELSVLLARIVDRRARRAQERAVDERDDGDLGLDDDLSVS